MATLIEKSEAILQRSDIVILTSVNKEGYPRPVPMSKIKTEGISTVWMATGKNSLKTIDFISNPKAGLCYYEEGNSIAFTGEVEIVADETLKKELWQDWFIGHFTEGPTDPNYVLLKFKALKATFWIDGSFVHRNVG